MDCITLFSKTRSGSIVILNSGEKLIKMIQSIPIPDNSNASEIEILFSHNVYRNHGLSEKIICDRDRIFMSKFWKSLFKLLISQNCSFNRISSSNRSKIADIQPRDRRNNTIFRQLPKRQLGRAPDGLQIGIQLCYIEHHFFFPVLLQIPPKTIPAHIFSTPSFAVSNLLTRIQKKEDTEIQRIREIEKRNTPKINASPHKFAQSDQVQLFPKILFHLSLVSNEVN